MTEFLGISFVSWQTILIIGLPLVYGSLPRLKAAFGLIRRPLGSPSSTQPGPPVRWRSLLRLRTLFLLASLAFLVLQLGLSSPARRNPFTLTNLGLSASPAALAAALARYHRARGLTESPVEQQRLLQRLGSLDARLLFATLGPDSLLHCSWCRPPSSKEPGHGTDHLLYTVARLALHYALLLVALGLMTTGARQLDMKRRTWRIRLAATAVCALIFETFLLSVLVHVPSVLTSMDSSRMAWDTLFTLRTFLFGTLLSIAWWAVITEPEETNSSAISKLGLGVAAVAAELDTLINRLRLAALQRSTVMRDHDYRSQTNGFWENAEAQARLAADDQWVTTLKNEMGLSESNHDNRDALKHWIHRVYPDPTSTDG